MLNKRQWIDRAVNYMLNLKLFDGTLTHEVDDAYELAESLWESSKNKDETNDSCPIEQVDEELTYWGD